MLSARFTSIRLYAYGLAVFVFFLDQISKIFVEWIIPYPGKTYSIISTFNFFRITFIHNPGAAWGILPGFQGLFISVAILVSGICIWMIETNPHQPSRYAWALILGGGLGNMIDRIFSNSGVVDFLDFGIYGARWPTFNLADASLSVGMVWLACAILHEEIQQFSTEPEPDDGNE